MRRLREVMQEIALKEEKLKQKWSRWRECVHLISKGTIAFDELCTELRVVGELLVQVKTFSLPLTKSLEEVFTDGHFVEVGVVGKQAFLVRAGSFDEVWADDDVALVVSLVATAVCVRQALPQTPVDWTNDVALQHGASGQERDAFRFRQTQMASDLMAVVALESSALRCFVSQSADVDSRHLEAAVPVVTLQLRSRRVKQELLASNDEHLLR